MAEPTTEGIKVVDAEPQTNQPSSPTAAMNPNLVLNNALDGFANLSSKFNPFAQKLGKGFGQVRQYAQERLGTAEDITELPQEYKDWKSVWMLFVVFTSIYSSQFQNLALSPAERAQVEQQVQQDEPNNIPRPYLMLSLFKLATINEKVGDARVKMDQEILTKFNQPMQTTLGTSIEQANKARRNVQSVRLSLDSCKARYRSARPERSDAARLEVEQAEDQFVAAVEEATSLMKVALENPEPLRNLADFVHAQVNYYKEAQALLSELAPELDEIQVTQESIYRSSRD
ncbi:unnamed protein product [Absidia cylindrospora]